MPDKSSNPEIVQLLLTLSKASLQHLQAGLDNLTPNQILIVLTVASHPGLSMKSLAARVGIAAAQLSRTIKSLETKKLVTRTYNLKNRREVNVSPTASGFAFAGKEAQQTEQAILTALEPLSASQLQALTDHLQAAADIMNQKGLLEPYPQAAKELD